MGGHLFSSHARRNDDSSSLFDRSPLSAGSSPSLLLLGNPAKTPTTTRSHVVVRFICSPLTAIFRMKCAGASTNDEDDLSDDKAGLVLGVAKRPSLEELLVMEASSSSCPEHKSLQDTVSSSQKGHAIVVFDITGDGEISCRVEKEQVPLSLSKSHGAVDANDKLHAGIVPVKVDLGGSPTVSPTSASLRRALLQALRMGMGRAKNGQYWKLAGSSDAGKAELFYQRPIPMGRRCRVQHLEESPYL